MHEFEPFKKKIVNNSKVDQETPMWRCFYSKPFPFCTKRLEYIVAIVSKCVDLVEFYNCYSVFEFAKHAKKEEEKKINSLKSKEEKNYANKF